MSAKETHETTLRLTQFSAILNAIAIASAMVIHRFSISELISVITKNGEKLSKLLEIVFHALLEGKDIALVERVKRLFPGNEYLELISGEEEIIIDACAGGYVISNDTLFVRVDHDLKNANEPSKPTPPTTVGVYRIQKSGGTLKQIFGSVTKRMELMELSLEQLQKFVLRHKRWLSKDGSTLVVHKNSKGEFFVSCVYLYGDGTPGVNIDQIDDVVCDAESCRHVIIPRLAL